MTNLDIKVADVGFVETKYGLRLKLEDEEGNVTWVSPRNAVIWFKDKTVTVSENPPKNPEHGPWFKIEGLV